jgi:multimeric flavodoxin WrbA
MKALIERAGLVSKANEEMFKYKVGAAVVAVRRAGATHVFSSMNFFFLIAQMIVVGSSYWNLGIGLAPGDVKKDGEGMQTFKNLGKNFAYVLQKLKS